MRIFRHEVRVAFATIVLFTFTTLSARSEEPLLDLGQLESKANWDKLTIPGLKGTRDPARPRAVDVEEPDDRLRIAFLGNTFIERAGHFGHLETEITRRHPDRDLVFRNLGWPGDDVTGTARIGFGPGEYRRSGWKPPDVAAGDYGLQRMLQQVAEARPDVLFIGFGSTVAFAGAAGIQRFEKGLGRLLDAVEPVGLRVVLLSPPPRSARGKSWPDPAPQNEWLSRVAKHLESTAKERGHLYVDVFGQLLGLQKVTAKEGVELSDNGIHLNEVGYRALAMIVAKSLRLPGAPWELAMSRRGGVESSASCRVEKFRESKFGLRFEVHDERLPSLARTYPRVIKMGGLPRGSYALDIGGRRIARGSAEAFAKGVEIERGPDLERAENLRRAIVRKNRLFFYLLRPQNEAYIYLFRRHERGHHEGEQAQFAAMVREREEEIARLRSPRSRFWEIVKERDYPDHEVPGGAQPPDVEAELKRFQVADGFEVNLFASEPMVTSPINLSWDERGRAWVATSTIYPHLAPGQEPDDRIVILEDLDGDGRADTSKVFADGLLVPQSVVPAKGGAYVTQSTDLLFLEDTDGDDRADRRHVLFTGFGNADVHHMIHGLRWGPGGDLYLTQSIYINSWVETPWGVRQLAGAGTWRLRPENLKLEVHSRGLVNPWGHAFDRFGQSFSTDGAGGGGPGHTFAGSAYRTAKGVRRTLETMNPGRPKECGLDVLSGRHLPESWRGNLVTGDFRANRVVRYELSDNGSGYSSKLHGDVLASTHRAYRPVDVKLGPDGAIYVVDWYSPIIDHGEVDFHHPLRDHRHGRIWRLTAKGRDLVKPPRLAGASAAELCAALEEPEGWTRDQARRVLRERGSKEAVPAIQKWLSAAAANDGADDEDRRRFERMQMEALWVLQGLRVVDSELLASVASASDFRVRAAAYPVVSDWSEKATGIDDLLAAGVVDENARVRLAAVTAAREIGGSRGAALALAALDRPLDRSLDYAVWLAARELESTWLPALEEGKPVFDGKPDRLAFALSAVGKKASLRPLVELVRTGKIAGPERRDALELIGSLGSPEELALVLDTAIEQSKSNAADAAGLLDALSTGARRGRPAPPNSKRAAEALTSSDARLLESAARLVGDWKVSEARDQLVRIVRDAAKTLSTRYSAALALGSLGDRGNNALTELSVASSESSATRVSATAALVKVDAGIAASVTMSLLVAAKKVEDVELLFDAFVGHQGAEAELATALKNAKLSSEVAAAGVRIALSTGREMKTLVDELTRAGGLKPITAMPPPDELAALLRDIGEKGDSARGEAIYRRDNLRCGTCHAIGGGGGKVGPDLSSLGGSSQVVHILEALLDPSAKIKEGYEPVVVLETTGAIHSGTIVRRGGDAVQVRDAKDQLISIPASRVAAVNSADTSIMPQGLTQTLRRDELVDLTRFLSELGRPGPYTLPTARFVRTWQALDATPAALAGGKDLDALVARADSLSWKPFFSRVDGSLPKSELPFLEKEGAHLLRFQIDAERATTLVVERSSGAASANVLWVNGKRVAIGANGTASLEKGANDCFLLVRGSAETIRVEMR